MAATARAKFVANQLTDVYSKLRAGALTEVSNLIHLRCEANVVALIRPKFSKSESRIGLDIKDNVSASDIFPANPEECFRFPPQEARLFLQLDESDKRLLWQWASDGGQRLAQAQTKAIQEYVRISENPTLADSNMTDIPAEALKVKPMGESELVEWKLKWARIGPLMEYDRVARGIVASLSGALWSTAPSR